MGGSLCPKELLEQGLSSVESWFRSGTELFHQVYTYHEVLVPVLFQVFTVNCYLDKKIREKVKYVLSRIQEIYHTISRYYLLLLKRKSQIVRDQFFHYFISLVFFLGVQERNGADGLSPSDPDRSESPCSDSQANRFLCFVRQSSHFHPPVQIISDPYLMSRTEKHRLSQHGVETGLHLGMEAGGRGGHGKGAP